MKILNKKYFLDKLSIKKSFTQNVFLKKEFILLMIHLFPQNSMELRQPMIGTQSWPFIFAQELHEEAAPEKRVSAAESICLKVNKLITTF